MSRVQGNLVARQERRFLDWVCSKTPSAITPDHLTAFGVLGAVMVLIGYVGTRIEPNFLWLAASGFVVHWFGDSLDGSLARYRNVVRPRYGYFVDHSLDALCIVLMVGGMGLSPYVSMSVALYVVVGYFAMSIHVFLRNAATGTFQLSFWAMGPTEMRIVFVAITLWMLDRGSSDLHMVGLGFSVYDVAMLVVGLVLMTLFVINTGGMIIHLRALEGDGRQPMQPEELESSRKTMSRPRIAAEEATIRSAPAPRGA